MTNTEAWDRVGARRATSAANEAVQYGPDVPTDAELRLVGDLNGKRVLDLGCGSGENAVAFARLGAHVIALDQSIAQLAVGRRLAESLERRVEWHRSDAADLAFLRADSIDLAFAAGLLVEIEDIDRLFRQVHRVLRPGAAFLFSYDHPAALAVGRDDAAPDGLPLGRLEVRRSYNEPGPMKVVRDGEDMSLWPRSIADVFAALHRAGYRVDVLLEPEPVRSSDPGPSFPTTIIWRARKEGL
ncbi:MAG: class I SAM-dependent methyltransferase [Actinomycetota bacterium]|nr:class I SAM-dependent methyltransferase [Actinomycetota bacterium]